jgi:hypothetical protein
MEIGLLHLGQRAILPAKESGALVTTPQELHFTRIGMVIPKKTRLAAQTNRQLGGVRGVNIHPQRRSSE